MEPILLIHGYSAEADTSTNRDSVVKIYGQLPNWLRRTYGDRAVLEVNLSRYVSLEDGIGLDDISRALDRALRSDYAELMQGTFHVIIHSTGALVVRNWLRKFAGPNQPIRNLIYLAGANFGSGWAHIGKGQLARWGRQVWSGSEAGVRVLEALELGSSETIELHRHFLEPTTRMHDHYGVREYVIVGSQPDTNWFSAPIRFSREDGSDGVVRVSAANLNFRYARYEANALGRNIAASEALRSGQRRPLAATAKYYDFIPAKSSDPGTQERPLIPMGIPYNCAHSGGETGVVDGKKNREQIEPLLRTALECRNVNQWYASRSVFDEVTAAAYGKARRGRIGGIFGRKGWRRQSQYDAHSQVIVRLVDQDDRPVPDYDIYFRRVPGSSSSTDIGDLIEHRHRNSVTPNVMTFYLRVLKWDSKAANGGGWTNRVDEIDGIILEVTAEETQTADIAYVPFRIQIKKEDLRGWLRPHTTTILDITMLRIPSSNVFGLYRH